MFRVGSRSQIIDIVHCHGSGAITAAYTAFVDCFNWLTSSDYMYLAAIPTHGSLLSVLGPWPWYTLSGAAVALVLLLILNAPFHRSRTGRYTEA